MSGDALKKSLSFCDPRPASAVEFENKTIRLISKEYLTDDHIVITPLDAFKSLSTSWFRITRTDRTSISCNNSGETGVAETLLRPLLRDDLELEQLRR